MNNHRLRLTLPDLVNLGGKLIGPLIFFLAGIGILTVSMISFYQTGRFVHHSLATSGTVTESRTFRGRGGGSRVTFTFTDGAGQEHTVRNDVYAKLGKVSVLYPPENPAAARIRSFRSLWLNPAFIGTFGIIFTGAGALLLYLFYQEYAELRRKRSIEWQPPPSKIKPRGMRKPVCKNKPLRRTQSKK